MEIPGGCTSFLQPLDTAINKGLKERSKNYYQLWLDSKRNLLQQNVNEGARLASTKCGNILAPTNENISDWFTKTILEESPQRIINAFISCGLTF